MKGTAITIVNHKGGVAKTTSVANIGEALSLEGKKVLLIDLDPQANLTQIFSPRIEEEIDPKRTILQTLQDRRNNYNIYRVTENLDLCPATLELATLSMELEKGNLSIEERFNYLGKFNDLKTKYDYILLDTPPSLSPIVFVAMQFSEEIFVPVVPETLPYIGLTSIEDAVFNLGRRMDTRRTITGIILTRVERGSLQEQITNKIVGYYGDRVFRTKVRKAVAVAQAPLSGESLFDFAPNSNAAKDYRNLAKEIIQRKENN